MKKTGRPMAIILTALFTVCVVSNLFGCSGGGGGGGGKVANDAQTLQIFISNFGYGYEWIDSEIEEFKKQPWVNEKYPELNIPKPEHNSDRDFVSQRIIAGPKANPVDLFFCTNGSSQSFHMRGDDGNLYFEELTDFYNSEVPGEPGVKIKEKMKSDIAKASNIERLQDGQRAYYGVPWVDGTMGLVCNETLIREIKGDDYVLPRTTKELRLLAEDIKIAQKKVSGKTVYPFIMAAKTNYWMNIFPIWWAQYEGLESFTRYFNGVDEYNQRSEDIFKQMGRLRGLEVIDSLINAENDFNHVSVNTMEFTEAQSKFLLGEGVMMPNGDWIENEMRIISSQTSVKYDIAFMKMPVISSIIEKCDTVKDDETLANVVQMVDDGKTYEQAQAAMEALTKKEYDIISEARRLRLRIEGHESYIPSYATAKELAKDFLRFLATDKGIETFMKATNGCSTPYNYDIETKSPELYESLSFLQKERLRDSEDAVRMPPYSQFRLYNYGGLSLTITPNFDTRFTARNAKDRMTPQELYQADIDHYGKDDNFNAMLRRAGLGGI